MEEDKEEEEEDMEEENQEDHENYAVHNIRDAKLKQRYRLYEYSRTSEDTCFFYYFTVFGWVKSSNYIYYYYFDWVT